MTSNASVFVPQTLPADVLVAIFSVLSGPQAGTLYAPFVCSHVCAHWRRVAIEAPLLWSYIDTSRGRGLTSLWLSRSKQVMLDVRLWERPLDRDLMYLPERRRTQPEAPLSSLDVAIQDVKDERHRWRSLNIAFSTIRQVVQTLAFLGDPYDTLHLEALTIGPMGSTTLVPDGWGLNSLQNEANPLLDIDTTRTHFQNLNVRCKVLRIDTYPISVSPVLFSPQLAVLEILTGCYYDHAIILQEWGQILSLTPNLVHLRLISFRHTLNERRIAFREPFDHPVTLPILEKLELSGAFVLIARLFQKSTLPKLDHLVFDTLSSSDGVPQLSWIATCSPPIRRLDISVRGTYSWSLFFGALRSIQEVTIFETGWEDAHLLMLGLRELENLERIRLERIWDLNPSSPMLSNAPLYGLPPTIELVDCQSPSVPPCKIGCSGVCICDNVKGEGSDFSGSSDFFPYEGDFPSSEESDSDESERSYGEDEGSEMGR
ncbi:hypothetical protein FRC12_013611 [Ceratobasidium sp. 428]|nr:hypothetical protein FRC12_013611 [Ceratobasidium sp. 428]